MQERFEVGAGLWWRFDRYEVRDGFIGAATGAKLTACNPWDRHRRLREKRGGAPEPSTSGLGPLVMQKRETS